MGQLDVGRTHGCCYCATACVPCHALGTAAQCQCHPICTVCRSHAFAYISYVTHVVRRVISRCAGGRPDVGDYRHYLPWFLSALPSEACAKVGLHIRRHQLPLETLFGFVGLRVCCFVPALYWAVALCATTTHDSCTPGSCSSCFFNSTEFRVPVHTLWKAACLGFVHALQPRTYLCTRHLRPCHTHRLCGLRQQEVKLFETSQSTELHTLPARTPLPLA